MMQRILIDTDVMVAAFSSDSGKSRELLVMVFDKKVKACASTSLYLEYETVLTRKKSLKMSGLTSEEVNIILDELATFIEPIGIHYQWRPKAHDPDDDLVIEAAVNGGVKEIISFNVKDMKKAAGDFGIEVLRPAEFIRRMKK